jgi:hypothetical protein
MLVGSAIPNSLSGNSTLLLPADKSSFKHTQFLESSFLQTSIDIGLVRKIEMKPLAVMIPKSRWGGQCLAYIQRLKNYRTEEFSGYPNKISPNTTEVKIGNVILTKEGYVGHVALIKDIQGNELILLESNFHSNGVITDNRRLDINNSIIRGYYSFDDSEDT